MALVMVQLASFLLCNPIGLSPSGPGCFTKVTQSFEVDFKLSGSPLMKFPIKSL